MIGDAAQADDFAQLRQVSEHRFDAAVVDAEQGLENKAGEELRLRRVGLGAATMGVIRERVLADGQRDPNHPPW